MRFAGKVAFVSGATSGINRATALAFAREGARVVVADIAGDGNQEIARLIEHAGGQALAVQCDVRRSDDIKAALGVTVVRFAGWTSPSTTQASSSRSSPRTRSATTNGTVSWRSTSAGHSSP